eukprot:m.145650 g.145650  ORF g.145650 m.145650 type:complete len:588 (-) comp17739_c0_seq7:269-2032(-)
MNRNRWKWLYSRDIISLTLAATLLFYWWAMVFRDIEPRWQDMRVGVDSRAPSSSSSPQIGKNDSIIREENTSLFHFDQRPSLESKRRPKEETPLGRTTTGGSTEGQNRLQKTRSTMISSLMSHTPHHRVIPRGRDCTSAGSCCRTTVQQRPTDLHTRVAFLLRHWNTPSFNPRDFNLSWSSSLRTVEATCILKIVGKHLIHNCDTCPRGRYHHAKAHMEIVRAAITWAQQHKRDIGDQQWVLTCSDKDFPTFPITDTPASPAPLNGFPPVSMAFQNNGLFYDVLFPTVTRGMFLPDRYAKNWQRRTSAARVSDSIGISRFATDNRTVWRGNVGCSIGCGPLGLFYNSTPDSIADVCDEGRARKSHPIKDPNVRGYTIGCDVDNYKAYSHPRIQLVEFSRNHPECGIDAGFVLPATEASKTLSRAFINAAGSPHWLYPHGFFPREVANTTSPHDLHAIVSTWLRPPIADTYTFPYMVHVGNNGFSDRLWMMLAAGVVVFWVDNGWDEWYYFLLEPYVHYIPVRADLSDLCYQTQWARRHPAVAANISANAALLVRQQMRPQDRDAYVAEILLQYGELLKRLSVDHRTT